MSDVAAQYLEADGWWASGEEGEPTLARAEYVETNEVMVQTFSIADYVDDEDRRDRELKLHMPALDALAFAKQIEAAAYESLAGVGPG